MTAMALQQATTQTHVGTIPRTEDGEANMVCRITHMCDAVTSGFLVRRPLSKTCLRVMVSSMNSSLAFGSQVLGINTLLTL